MFLELIALLTQFDSGFGVLNYLTLRAVLAMLASLLISLALGHYFIKKLHLYQIGQVIRTDGPQSHLSKSGTPTMGGVMILSAFIISSLVWADWSNHYLWIVLATAVIFGAVGFVDDYLKIKRKSSDGLSSRKKNIRPIFRCYYYRNMDCDRYRQSYPNPTTHPIFQRYRHSTRHSWLFGVSVLRHCWQL